MATGIQKVVVSLDPEARQLLTRIAKALEKRNEKPKMEIAASYAQIDPIITPEGESSPS